MPSWISWIVGDGGDRDTALIGMEAELHHVWHQEAIGEHGWNITAGRIS